MAFELNEIGATLAAGMYFVFGLGVLCLVLRPEWTRAALGKVQESKLPFAVASGILAFAFGILLERLSNLAADEFPIEGLILDEDKDIRAEVFRSRFADDYTLESAHISRVWGPHGPHMIEQIAEATRHVKDDSVMVPGRAQAAWRDVATEIYFEAKSAVMRDDNYFADLTLTQTHIRFARSFAVTSFAFAGMALVLAILRLLLGMRPSCALPCGARAYARDCGIIILVFATLWGATRTAYRLEEEHYDARVFGYYLHLIRNPRGG